MKKLIAALLLLVSVTVGAQLTVSGSTTAPRISHSFGDDTWVHVPLQFPFPMYGRVFTNSFMFSNGVVGFYGTNMQPYDSYCCTGVVPSTSIGSGFNYTILPMHTDLLPGMQSTFWSEGNANYQKYYWKDIAEISNGNNLNSFGVEIRPSGYVGIWYDQIRIQNQQVTSAIIGNASLGEYVTHYTGVGMNSSSVPSLIEYQSTSSACTSNPLANPACPGYFEAYLAQQCSSNPLFSNQCPGYATAYYNQQCSNNPLYAVTCPGYAEAYFTQQCTSNPLSNTQCPGYAVAYKSQQCSLNALYATDCPGYAAAYKTQQCNLNPLYATDCPGYAVAYKNQQCSLNALYATDCPGYAIAYKAEQCSLNALYATDCPGYAAAYKNQQCTLNQLYATDCPGYTVAYKAEQCSLNALYASDCPGYATAYALKYVVNVTPTTTTAATTTTVVAQTEPQKVDPVASAVSSDPVVSAAVTPPSATSVTSVTSVINKPATPEVVTTAASPAPTTASRDDTQKQEQKQQDQKSTSNQVASVERKATSKEDAKKQAGERAKEVAKAAAKAPTMEAQQAQQGLVLGLMNYVPGFDVYNNSMIPDPNAQIMANVYGKPPVDNRQTQRRLSGASDAKWQQMVDSQYQLGK